MKTVVKAFIFYKHVFKTYCSIHFKIQLKIHLEIQKEEIKIFYF